MIYQKINYQVIHIIMKKEIEDMEQHYILLNDIILQFKLNTHLQFHHI